MFQNLYKSCLLCCIVFSYANVFYCLYILIMSSLMKRNLKFLELLSKVSPKTRRDILKYAPKELVQAISEGAYNVLKGNVKLSKKKFAALKRQKSKLRLLASAKTSRKRKNEVIQKGGFIGLLSSILIPAIAGIIQATT